MSVLTPNELRMFRGLRNMALEKSRDNGRLRFIGNLTIGSAEAAWRGTSGRPTLLAFSAGLLKHGRPWLLPSQTRLYVHGDHVGDLIDRYIYHLDLDSTEGEAYVFKELGTVAVGHIPLTEPGWSTRSQQKQAIATDQANLEDTDYERLHIELERGASGRHVTAD